MPSVSSRVRRSILCVSRGMANNGTFSHFNLTAPQDSYPTRYTWCAILSFGLSVWRRENAALYQGTSSVVPQLAHYHWGSPCRLLPREVSKTKRKFSGRIDQTPF